MSEEYKRTNYDLAKAEADKVDEQIISALQKMCIRDRHLSDDMVTLLSSGKINNRLLCEIATHENFQRLMTDIEIFVDRIADMRIAQMNLVLEATRQEVIRSHAPGENDLYVRTLELGQVQESDFFSHTIHDDLDSIVKDIRQAHITAVSYTHLDVYKRQSSFFWLIKSSKSKRL